MPKQAISPYVVEPVILNRGQRKRGRGTNLFSPRSAKAQPTILWIDDFEAALTMYGAMYERLGFRVLAACSGHDGLQLALANSNSIDIVVTDYEMPGMNGEAVAMAIKALNHRTPVVLFSGSTLVPERIRCIVDAVCDKASPRNQLLATLHRLLHRKRSRSLQPVRAGYASEHRQQRTVA